MGGCRREGKVFRTLMMGAMVSKCVIWECAECGSMYLLFLHNGPGFPGSHIGVGKGMNRPASLEDVVVVGSAFGGVYA